MPLPTKLQACEHRTDTALIGTGALSKAASDGEDHADDLQDVERSRGAISMCPSTHATCSAADSYRLYHYTRALPHPRNGNAYIT